VESSPEGDNTRDGDEQTRRADGDAPDSWHGGGPDGEETRLDDFWSMQLERPVPEEVVRKGTYLIRQQRFRELCEDASPARALNYLQNEVYAVVNHSDLEEESLFRSLLSHLLTPSARSTAGASEPQRPASRKRSRSAEPQEKVARQRESVTDSDMAEDASPSSSRVEVRRSLERPRYVISLEEDPAEGGSSGGGQPPSPARYKQRMDVYESLMKYMNADAKEPDSNLIDMLNID